MFSVLVTIARHIMELRFGEVNVTQLVKLLSQE